MASSGGFLSLLKQNGYRPASVLIIRYTRGDYAAKQGRDQAGGCSAGEGI